MAGQPSSGHVTLVEVLQVVGPFDEVASLLRSLVQRIEREGVRGIAAMQFYADRAAGELGAVITMSDPAQLTAHVELISGWEEFRRFASQIRLVDMRVHGRLPPSVEGWIRGFGGPVRTFEEHVEGFVR